MAEEEELPGVPLMLADSRGDLSEGQQRRRLLLKDCWRETGDISKKCWQNKNVRILLTLILGQLLSLLLCGTGVTSQLLVTDYSISIPTTQLFLVYIFLGAVYGVPVVVRSDFLTLLRHNWWKYIILGVVDLEANYLVVLAYKYTNITIVQLLDSFTIAVVMVLSFIFLRARYKIINFMGVALSIVGILTLVLADVQGSRAGKGSNPLVGDLLCLGGALLYATSNVAQEFLVKNHGVTEYLGFIGVTGSIASAIQLLVIERSDLVRIEWNGNIGLLLLGFTVSQFLFYSIVPHLLRLASAVVFNLSLLTADIYTLLFGLFLFHYRFSFFYVLAFLLIVIGVFIYNLRQPSTAPKKKKKEKEKEKREREKEEQGRGSQVLTGLRRALFESQTYEMSENREKSGARATNSPSSPPPTARKPKGFFGKLSSKLSSKLLSKLPNPPTPADHSALSSSSRKRMRTFENLAEDDTGGIADDDGFFGASKEGLIRAKRSSSGSERAYGSVEKTSPRTSSSPPPPSQ